MGYAPDHAWMAAQLSLAARASRLSAARQVSEALQLTLERAIGELQWKMRRSPEFDDSGSITRVLHDLMAARDGVTLLTRPQRARR